MLDKEIEQLMDKKGLDTKKTTAKHDEVDEASDSSFPASDPPAYTSAPPRNRTRYAKPRKD